MTTEATSQTTTPRATGPRKLRPVRAGVVTSAGRDKTICVQVSYTVRHPKYGKYIRRRTVLHAHDEKNECHTGDRVEIMQCRPLSKTKSWRLVRVVKHAPGTGGGRA